MSKKIYPFSLLLITLLVMLLILPACSAQSEGDLSMMPLNRIPQEVQDAPLVVQQAYQFSAANPEVMKQIPCYCGCQPIGHESNYACYVSGTDESGNPIFDNHALGCSICVDITQDVMRLLKQGRTVDEIREYVDATYSKYGPSNMP